MKNKARRLLVYSLAVILLSGVGATIAQAAPQGREDRQQQEETKLKRSKQQPRVSAPKQRPRANVQKQQPRANVQRQQSFRSEMQYPEQQRLSVLGQNNRLWQQRNNHTNSYFSVRQHVYNDDRYRGSNWRDSGESFTHRQPWAWRSRNHEGRRFISDSRWEREFPGLRSYRWFGAGFWYQGTEYRDLVLFYDDGDELVSVGFWNHGRFVMIRDDNRSYYNDNAFVLGYQNHNLQLQIRL